VAEAAELVVGTIKEAVAVAEAIMLMALLL
jgi:hypothetical protein